MKNFSNIYQLLFIMLVMLFVGVPVMANVQQDSTQVEERIDDSSAFQDSIKYDDMDPIFYEAEEEVVVETESSGGTMKYVIIAGILVVLVVIIGIVRKSSAKKS